MAWDFCVNFARDNDLQVAEACLVPDPDHQHKDGLQRTPPTPVKKV